MHAAKINGIARIWAKYIAAALAGCVVALIVAVVVILNGRPDLSVWHLADLDEEYTAKSDVSDFAGYLALEERLFRQLDSEVYAKVPTGTANALNRFSRQSLSDPGRWPSNWNRTFELRNDSPRAGVLLLHGLSDSPYSLRALGESLHQQGANVVGLRIPGHGTAPSGLVEARWRDMAAAVRIAMRHVSDAADGAPLFVVGYSNGGALAIEYALDALQDDALPQLSGIVLLSPEIGISATAAFAVWQGRLGHFLGLDKLAWNALLPEIDPFKYGSFAINAGDLAYRITRHIQNQLSELQRSGALEEMPPILAFQSSVDATVTASALVENLFSRLAPAGHELVLFDINRRTEIESVLKLDPATIFGPLLENEDRGFDLTVIANENGESLRAFATTTNAGEDTPSTRRYVGDWPADIYSLSHVALPIRPDDAVYGGPAALESPGIQLGNLAFRGERGVLQISGTDAMRLRWNPFFGYVEARTLAFMQLNE